MNMNLEVGQIQTTPQIPTGTLTTILVEVVLLAEGTFLEDEMITMIVVTTNHVPSLGSHLAVVVHHGGTMTVVGERGGLNPLVTVVVDIPHHRAMEEEEAIKVFLLLIVATLATHGTEGLDSSLVFILTVRRQCRTPLVVILMQRFVTIILQCFFGNFSILKILYFQHACLWFLYWYQNINYCVLGLQCLEKS